MATNPKDFEESKKVAKQGGYVARVARKELEARTGKKVVTALNAKAVLGKGNAPKNCNAKTRRSSLGNLKEPLLSMYLTKYNRG